MSDTSIHCTLTIHHIDTCLLSFLLIEYVPSTDVDILLHFPELCHLLLAWQQHLLVNNSSCSGKWSRRRRGMLGLLTLTADYPKCQWLRLNPDWVSIRQTSNCSLDNFSMNFPWELEIWHVGSWLESTHPEWVFLALVRPVHVWKEEGKIPSMNKALATLVTSGISYL